MKTYSVKATFTPSGRIPRIGILCLLFTLTGFFSWSQPPTIEWTINYIEKQFEQANPKNGENLETIDIAVMPGGLIHISVLGPRPLPNTWGQRYFPSEFSFFVRDIERVDIFDNKLAFWCVDREPCIQVNGEDDQKLMMAGIAKNIDRRNLNASIQAFWHLMEAVQTDQAPGTNMASKDDFGL